MVHLSKYLLTQLKFYQPPLRLKKNKQHGFTLVELVMVIVLLAIVSATALPRFFSKTVFEERVLFDDTLSAARYAQKLSVATGCKTVFSISANQYQLLQGASCNTLPFTSPVTNPAKGGAYTGQQDGISMTATHADSTFDALGTADVDNTITIGARTFAIIAATGFTYDSSP
jgi:MSHA pilin protein MshC